MTPRRSLLAASAALFLLAPSAADAAQVTMGSDLQAPAMLDYADPNDWAAWDTTMLRSPVQGEITSVNLKGFMQLEGRGQQPPAPGLVMHVMVIRPRADGSVSLADPTLHTDVSKDLPLPLEQDPDKITSYDRTTLSGNGRLCIQAGDYLAFTTSGGFGGMYGENPEQIYLDGAHFQVFGRVPTATTLFHNQGGAYTYDAFRGTANNGRELLMNATIGTREDARWTCRTDAEKKQNLDAPAPTSTPAPSNHYTLPTGRATLVKPRKAPKVRGRKVKIPVLCSAVGACSGTLMLRTYAAKRAFTLAAGQTGTVTLTINKRARKKLTRRGARLTVKAMLVSDDGSKQSLRFKVKRA